MAQGHAKKEKKEPEVIYGKTYGTTTYRDSTRTTYQCGARSGSPQWAFFSDQYTTVY